MGFDEAKLQREIDGLLEQYRTLHLEGDFAAAHEIIHAARRKYPQDFRVMHAFMWDQAGQDVQTMLKNQKEIQAICETIINSCTTEAIRLDAINMQAKLLHAQGETDRALEILSQLPGWGSSQEQRKEQLYEKDTPQYRHRNRKNCYALMDAMANKLARTVWYEDALPMQERIRRLEQMGDTLLGLTGTPGLESFCIAAQMIYAELAGRASESCAAADVVRVRNKQFAAMKQMIALAQTDRALKDCVLQTYRTEDILSWQVDWLLNAKHPQFAQLRENEEYMALLRSNQK